MESTAGPLRASGRWLVALFWPASTGPDIKFILASLPVQVAAPAIVVILWLATAGAGAGFLPGKLTPLILILTVCAMVLTAAALPALTLAQRRLLRAMRGVDIPPPPPRSGAPPGVA